MIFELNKEGMKFVREKEPSIEYRNLPASNN